MRLVIIVVSLFFIYVGIAAYSEIRLIRLLRSAPSEKEDPRSYEGHTFNGQADMEIFMLEQQRNRFWPWTAPLEEWLVLLTLAACASFLGSAVRYIRDSLDRRKRPIATYCLLGFVIGPSLMAATWASELLILEGESRFRPETMAAVCFLAGIFVKESWNYISKLGRRHF